jgi:hypothetical protein
MHHALYYADLFIGDSQTMTAEAAVLGTPSLRFNDFVGQLSYLEELEHKWKLTFGFKTTQRDALLHKLQELISTPEIKNQWQQRRENMLNQSINLTAMLQWFIEQYPASQAESKHTPNFYKRFIHS